MICPICNKEFKREEAAVSRKDNSTYICSDCGTQEALNDVPIGLISEKTKQEILALASKVHKEKRLGK